MRGPDHFLLVDVKWKGAAAQLELERLQITPKDYQCKFNNCRGRGETRITDELLKSISCVKLPPCWSKLFNSKFSDSTILCSPENKPQVRSLNLCSGFYPFPLRLLVLLIVFQQVQQQTLLIELYIDVKECRNRVIACLFPFDLLCL